MLANNIHDSTMINILIFFLKEIYLKFLEFKIEKIHPFHKSNFKYLFFVNFLHFNLIIPEV